MIMKYKNRRIKTEKRDITTFAYCVDKKNNQIGQAIVDTVYGEKDAINKMKKLVNRAIHYNGY